MRFLIDGAPVPADAAAYERIVLLFDGDDPDAVAAARARWSEAKAKGFDGHLLAAGRAGALAAQGLSRVAERVVNQSRLLPRSCRKMTR